MNAKRLLVHFEQVADAPDAIPRLRRLILDLAVRGKLVEQDSRDESANNCLNQARRRLELAAKTTKRLRWKPSTPISRDDVNKNIPNGWTPARINDTGLYVNGLAFKPSDWKQTGLPIIRIQNLTDPTKEFNFAEGDFPDEVLVREGDILVSWSATLEAFKWNNSLGVLNQHIFRVIRDEELTNPDFLLLLLRHAIREMADSEHAHGLVMSHINRGPFLNHVVLIPPFTEQQRIVTKVDELMALCDQFEAAQTEKETKQQRLTAANLARLNEPDPETFRDDARFALSALPALTKHPDQITQLRRTILNLAVRGKLVKQDPSDEPAEELLKRIAAEKEQLVKEGKSRKTKQLSPIDTANTPFDLPSGWAWARFPEVGLFGRGKSKHRPRNDPILYTDGKYPFIQTGDVARSGGLIKTYNNHYNDVGLAQSEMWPTGTLCITIAANIAESGILSFDACFPDSVVGLIAHHSFEGAHYFDYFIRIVKTDLQEFAPSTAQKNINLGILGELLIPLPPLAEQHRIVAKVDELMALCDELEENLANGEDTQSRLLDALLAEAIGA